MSNTETSELPRPLIALCWLVTLTVTLLPVLRAELPPGADMLNHVARLHVLHTLPFDTDLQRYYLSGWGILPNLAMDIVTWPLLYFMSAYQAGKAFVVISILLMFAGVSALRFQLHGKVGLLPLCVALIAYNAPLAMGFANFYFGLGLSLLMIAGWLAMTNRPGWQRTGIGNLFAIMLFFTHLIILGLYGFILAMHRGGEYLRGERINVRRDTPLIAQFIIPAILWFQVKAPAHGTETVFGSLFTRLEALITPVLYFNDFDIVIAIALIALLGWLLASRRIGVAAPLLIPILALSILSLLMPVRLAGVWLTHIRLPVMVALLLISAIEIRMEERRLRVLIAATLVLFTMLRLEKVDRSIAGCDAKRLEFTDVISALPTGARVLPVFEKSSVTGDCIFSNYWNLPALAVIEKSVFYPMMFVHMQPLAIRPEFNHLVQKIAEPAPPELLSGNAVTYGEADWNATITARWRKEFDYLIWLHPGTKPGLIPKGISAIGGAEFFTLYRIDDK